jgi:hypothetical protein
MKWPAFAYLRADSLDDVWRAQAEHGAAAQVIAGGQTLLATLAFRLSEPGCWSTSRASRRCAASPCRAAPCASAR